MPWTLDDTRPIYLQLEDIIKSKIIAGIYKPGQKLPSVRELAAEAAVNIGNNDGFSKLRQLEAADRF